MTDSPQKEMKKGDYWSKNLRRLAVLLSIWFTVSFGASILFVDQLDRVEFFGFKLGFWFAQQGSIYVFLLLIVIYVKWMNRLDDEYDVADRRATDESGNVVEPREKKGTPRQ